MDVANSGTQNSERWELSFVGVTSRQLWRLHCSSFFGLLCFCRLGLEMYCPQRKVAVSRSGRKTRPLLSLFRAPKCKSLRLTAKMHLWLLKIWVIIYRSFWGVLVDAPFAPNWYSLVVLRFWSSLVGGCVPLGPKYRKLKVSTSNLSTIPKTTALSTV